MSSNESVGNVYDLTAKLNEAFGQEVKQSRDCGKLAEDITRVTGRAISKATLRRQFGFLSSQNKLSAYNTETINIYVAKKTSIKTVIWENRKFSDINEIEKNADELIHHYGGLNEALLNALYQSDLEPKKFFDLLIYFIKSAVNNQNTSFFTHLYSQKGLRLNHIQVFRTLGIALKEHTHYANVLINHLVELPNARLYFFENFVDFGNFNSYQKWLKIYFEKEPTTLKKLWSLSVLNYGYFLQMEEVSWGELGRLFDKSKEQLADAHPYLKARIYGVMLQNEEWSERINTIINQELTKELTILEGNEEHHPLFSIMILQYLLIRPDSFDHLQLVYRIFKTYNNKLLWPQDIAIDFNRKVCAAIFGINELSLNEVKSFSSGHTNEDVVTKSIALNYVEGFEKSEEQKEGYLNKLLAKNSFVRLKQLQLVMA